MDLNIHFQLRSEPFERFLPISIFADILPTSHPVISNSASMDFVAFDLKL